MSEFKTSESQREYLKRYYRAHKEKMNAQSRAYHLAHREEQNEKTRIRQQANKEKRKEYLKRYMETNGDKVKVYHRGYWSRFKDRLYSANRKWAKDHPEKVHEYMLRWNRNHKDIISERGKRYRALHPEMGRRYCMKRRALKKGASLNLEGIKQFMDKVNSKKTFRCYYCCGRFGISFCHFDHIIPLSKGGEHSVRNLCTSCASCNLSKHAHTPATWNHVGQQVFSI